MELREVVASRRDDMVLGGEVEIDGKYVVGHVRPKNKAEDRVDRRLKANRSPDRFCASAIRQRGSSGTILTRIIREENGHAAVDAVKDHVSRSARVFADEHASYNHVLVHDPMGRVDHSNAYAAEDGTNTNLVESFFSRIQRASVCIHHRFSKRYLDWYVADLAWKEDTRLMSIGGLTRSMVAQALRQPTSRYLYGSGRATSRRI